MGDFDHFERKTQQINVYQKFIPFLRPLYSAFIIDSRSGC